MKKQRADVLMGKDAEAFARENTNFYLTEGIYDKSGFQLLKSSNSDEYYLAKIMKKEKFFSSGAKYVIDIINITPFSPVFTNGEPRVAESILSVGCSVDVCASDSEEQKTLYFGKSLNQFKNEEDRNNFDWFCLESCANKPKFDSLDKLSEYFSDENFVSMAKDKTFFLAFKMAEDMTTIGKNLLEHKIKKEIDKRVIKYANKTAGSGQMGE